MVVMNGLATTAGSSLSFFANNGRHEPTIFAMQMVQKSETDTTSEIVIV